MKNYIQTTDSLESNYYKKKFGIMTEILGSFCLVLHSHLPWVIGHGVWPHGK